MVKGWSEILSVQGKKELCVAGVKPATNNGALDVMKCWSVLFLDSPLVNLFTVI
jgi:hypothetical protein